MTVGIRATRVTDSIDRPPATHARGEDSSARQLARPLIPARLSPCSCGTADSPIDRSSPGAAVDPGLPCCL